MNSALLSIKIDPRIKKQAQKTAKDLGFNVSGLVNAYLRHFIKTETVFFSSQYEEPTDYLLDTVKKAQEEITKGNYYKFKSNKDSLDFLKKEVLNGQ